MIGRGSRLGAARLLCAAAALALVLAPGCGQAAPARRRRRRPTLPSSIRARRSTRCLTSASPGPSSTSRTRAPPASSRADSAQEAPSGAAGDDDGDIRYSVAGRRAWRRSATPKICSMTFRQAVGAGGRAQGPGQCRPDRPPRQRRRRPADRIAAQPGLLRCRGRAADRKRRRRTCASSSTADPGPQYRFASVDLPGLDAAGPDAAKLRDAFAVQGRRSGHCRPT